MADNAIKISITGKLSYSDEITIGQATQIVAFLNSDGSDGAVVGESLAGNGSASRNPKVKQVDSARAAIETSGAQKNPEKIVALGAYILQDGGETFKAEDVKSQFRRARETLPGNFARDLGIAVSSGWISEDDDVSGEYYLTTKMDGIFDDGFAFPKGSSGGGRQRNGSTTSSKAKNAKPETLVDIDEFHSTMDGFLPYAKMRSEKDRLLWVAIYMRNKHSRKGVTNKEISWISDHIGTGIPSDNVSGAFNSAKKPGYAIRSTMDKTMKVTDEGIEYLASLSTEA